MMNSVPLRYPLQTNSPKFIAPEQLNFDRSAIDAFLAACHRRRYPTKTTIMRPGDSASTLYYIISGSLTVS